MHSFTSNMNARNPAPDGQKRSDTAVALTESEGRMPEVVSPQLQPAAATCLPTATARTARLISTHPTELYNIYL